MSDRVTDIFTDLRRFGLVAKEEKRWAARNSQRTRKFIPKEQMRLQLLSPAQVEQSKRDAIYARNMKMWEEEAEREAAAYRARRMQHG